MFTSFGVPFIMRMKRRLKRMFWNFYVDKIKHHSIIFLVKKSSTFNGNAKVIIKVNNGGKT